MEWMVTGGSPTQYLTVANGINHGRKKLLHTAINELLRLLGYQKDSDLKSSAELRFTHSLNGASRLRGIITCRLRRDDSMFDSMFDLADDRENKPGQKRAQQRCPDTAQSHGHAHGGRHPNGGRRRQSSNLMLRAQLENGSGADKADAGGQPLNHP